MTLLRPCRPCSQSQLSSEDRLPARHLLTSTAHRRTTPGLLQQLYSHRAVALRRTPSFRPLPGHGVGFIIRKPPTNSFRASLTEGCVSVQNSIASTCRTRISVSHTINSSANESWTYPAVYHEQGVCAPRSVFSLFWYNLQAAAVRHHDGRYVRRHSSREKFPP